MGHRYQRPMGHRAMFSDCKSHGFGLEHSQLRTPERLGRLVLVMSIALYFAVSTGLWDATTHSPMGEKKPTPPAREPDPRSAAYRQTPPIPPANAVIMSVRMKLTGGESHSFQSTPAIASESVE